MADALRFGDEGPGYAAIQVLLEQLRISAEATNASLLDRSGVTIYDCRGPQFHQQVSPLDTLASPALRQALAGAAATSADYLVDGRRQRATFAPVADDSGRVVSVLAVEAEVAYLALLEGFGRSLFLIALLIASVIVVLVAIRVRLDRRAAELERRLSRAENLAAMGRLTATLAHEIKNPLAIIRGSAQRLGKLEPEAQRMADFVVEESDRLSRTVARYLMFARGNQSAEGTGDALQSLDATLDLLQGELEARQVALVRDGDRRHAVVRLDNESLKQVYLNLILNAVEAMPEGGQLRVSTAGRRGWIEITIADRGPGIPAETLRDLGRPFFSTKPQGSGLGLFLTQRLLQSAGGTLELRSTQGQGTTCTVRLPADPSGPEPQAGEAEA